MAFEQTNGRYASFGVVTSLPGEVIDSFWYVIDHYLKGVIPLKNVIRFSIKIVVVRLRWSFRRKVIKCTGCRFK